MRSNLVIYHFNEKIGPYMVDKVAMYDADAIDARSVKEIIASGEYSKDVIIVTEAQYNSVFRSVIQSPV